MMGLMKGNIWQICMNERLNRSAKTKLGFWQLDRCSFGLIAWPTEVTCTHNKVLHLQRVSQAQDKKVALTGDVDGRLPPWDGPAILQQINQHILACMPPHNFACTCMPAKA
jgi:hypothetical protein